MELFEASSQHRLPAGLLGPNAGLFDEPNPKTLRSSRDKQWDTTATAGSHRSPVGHCPLPVTRWPRAVLLGQGPGAGIAELLLLRAADVPCHHAPLPAARRALPEGTETSPGLPAPRQLPGSGLGFPPVFEHKSLKACTGNAQMIGSNPLNSFSCVLPWCCALQQVMPEGGKGSRRVCSELSSFSCHLETG